MEVIMAFDFLTPRPPMITPKWACRAGHEPSFNLTSFSVSLTVNLESLIEDQIDWIMGEKTFIQPKYSIYNEMHMNQ